MAEQKIQLRQIRDFGQNINDVFVFIKQNLKPLLQSFFAICSLFMVVQAIFNGLYQSQSAGIFQQIFSGRAVRQDSANPYGGIFSIEYALTLVFMLITYVAMKVTLGAYIKFYLENDGQAPGIEDVWNLFRKYFLKVFIYSIPVALLSILGCLFCLVPGVYLWVAWMPFTMVVMVEDADFSTASTRCFELIKTNFWPSFLLYVVAYLIYSFSSSIIGIAVGLVAGAAAYLTTNNIGATVGIVTSFLNIFSFIFYIIFFISAALQYFSLTEQRDGTGILHRIENIGSDKNNFDHIDEQF